jgi:hypothetical protein
MDDVRKVNNCMYLFFYLSFRSVRELKRMWEGVIVNSFTVLEGMTKSNETLKIE